jgi:hypothetical protein
MATPALFLRHVSATKWDNAFINFDHRTWFPAPNYVVMKLYRDHYQRERVQLTGDLAGLSAVATRSPDADRVVLKLVNPTDDPVSVRIACQGGFIPAEAKLQLVAPDSLDARNTLDQPAAVRVVNGQIERDGAAVRFALPRLSVGVIDLARPAAPKPPLVVDSPAHTARIAWWQEARFGMFIHWGLFAIPAGEWNGCAIAGNVEWIQARAKIPRDDYAKLAAQFFVQLTTNYQAARPIADISATNQLRDQWDSFQFWNVEASYRVTPKLRLTGTGRNLTSERQAASQVGGIARTRAQDTGIAWVFSVKYDL